MNNLDLIDETIEVVCSEIKYNGMKTKGYADAVMALAKLVEARANYVTTIHMFDRISQKK